MMIYKEYPFLKIEVDNDNALIIMIWNGLFSSAEYREATKTCLRAVKEFNLKYWLADTSKIDEIIAEDQDWTNDNILVPISEAGVIKVAIVIPENVFNHLAISSIMVKGKDRFKFDSQYFLNKAEALKWFRVSRA